MGTTKQIARYIAERAHLLPAVLGPLLAAILTPLGLKADTTTFPARLTLKLCPEYQFGGVTLELKYSVGADPTLFDPQIVRQSIDPTQGRAVFDLALPSTLAKSDIRLHGYCRSARGLSNASNVLAISNCSALAIRDTDRDGLNNNAEDTNCNNLFDAGDVSNFRSFDTDGDGARDLQEVSAGTDASNPGSAPRPTIYAGAAFDPDNDGNSNPVVWRPSNGTFYIKDLGGAGKDGAYQWGLSGDIPFVYNPKGQPSDVGVIRSIGGTLTWYFRGTGFIRATTAPQSQLQFGSAGDMIVLGPWEQAGVTSPALARSANGEWTFLIYKQDGTVRTVQWGSDGDIPRVGDYSGDGLFDFAVFRPSTLETLVLNSVSNAQRTIVFTGSTSGIASADYTFRGDVNGDAIDDITFWDPVAGAFKTVRSPFNSSSTSFQLGTYLADVPLAWNKQNGKVLFTVINHQSGVRSYKAGNAPTALPTVVQWGLPGDHQG